MTATITQAPTSLPVLPQLDRLGTNAATTLTDLQATIFGRSWRSDDIKTLLGDPGVMAWVSSYRDTPVGFGLFRTVAVEEAEILALGVLPSYRRSGIARHILLHACRELKARLCDTIFLEVDANNNAAIKLYKETGFEVVTSRPGYYLKRDGSRTDALVMRLCLRRV